MLNLILGNLPLIAMFVAGFILIRNGGAIFGKIGEAVGELAKSGISGFQWAVVLIILSAAAIGIFRPETYGFFTGLGGPFGPNLLASRAEAELKTAILDPLNNPALWRNEVAQEAARSVGAEFQAKTAQQLAKVSAEEAEKACRLPKGHDGRKAFDEAGVDPCDYTIWPSLRVLGKNIDQLDAREAKLLQPVGIAPAGSPDWIKSVYQVPRVGLYTVLLVPVMLVLLFVTSGLLKALRR